jgi:hypothetical protein
VTIGAILAELFERGQFEIGGKAAFEEIAAYGAILSYGTFYSKLNFGKL